MTEIADYLVPRNPIGAERVRAAILLTPQTVVNLPHAGRLQTADGVRMIVVRGYPYLVYYRIDEEAEEIVVLTVRHSARRHPFRDA